MFSLKIKTSMKAYCFKKTIFFKKFDYGDFGISL